MKAIQPGDAVSLKRNKLILVVEKLEDVQGVATATCWWFSEAKDRFRRTRIPVILLEHFERNQGRQPG